MTEGNSKEEKFNSIKLERDELARNFGEGVPKSSVVVLIGEDGTGNLGFGSGGGAGGSIYIDTDNFTGTGSLTADGGVGGSDGNDGGGGAGGRIAVYYNDIEFIDITSSSVTGGSATAPANAVSPCRNTREHSFWTPLAEVRLSSGQNRNYFDPTEKLIPANLVFGFGKNQ